MESPCPVLLVGAIHESPLRPSETAFLVPQWQGPASGKAGSAGGEDAMKDCFAIRRRGR